MKVILFDKNKNMVLFLIFFALVYISITIFVNTFAHKNSGDTSYGWIFIFSIIVTIGIWIFISEKMSSFSLSL